MIGPPMLDSLGQLYTAGARIDWESFDDQARCRHLSLPTYPFQRQRYWLDDVPRASSIACPVRRLAGRIAGNARSDQHGGAGSP